MEVFFPSKHSANLTDTIHIFKKNNLFPNIGLNPYANSVATGQDHDTAWMDILSLGQKLCWNSTIFPHALNREHLVSPTNSHNDSPGKKKKKHVGQG